MNIKDILSDKQSAGEYIFNTQYYSGIYKKTEKIVCAVFLITDSIKDQDEEMDVIRDIRRVAKDALLGVVDLLALPEDTRSSLLVSRDLLALRSLLYVLVAPRKLRGDLADVLAREIDGVIQNVYELRHVTRGEALADVLEQEPGFVQSERSKKLRPSPALSRRGDLNEGVRIHNEAFQGSSRRDSVLAIIRARGVVSIKDISDSITDCSEKTIQRELLSLMKDSIIVREGERRWSKYKLV